MAQPDFFFAIPVVKLLLMWFACSCGLFACILLLHCCTGIEDWLGNPGFGGFSDWGDICIPGGLLGCLQVHVLSLVPEFSYMSIIDFTELFWSDDAYFKNQDGTYITYLHFSISCFLV